MENMGMGAWPGPMPGAFPAAALPLVSPVQGSLKGKCDVLSFVSSHSMEQIWCVFDDD